MRDAGSSCALERKKDDQFAHGFVTATNLCVRAATTAMREKGAAGDRRHNANGVAVLGRGIFLCKVANILIVYIDVYEAAQLSVLGEQVLAQLAEFGGQPAQGFAHGA